MRRAVPFAPFVARWSRDNADALSRLAPLETGRENSILR